MFTRELYHTWDKLLVDKQQSFVFLTGGGGLFWLRGNLWETVEFFAFFFNIDLVVFKFDKLGKVASKRNPNPNLDPDRNSKECCTPAGSHVQAEKAMTFSENNSRCRQYLQPKSRPIKFSIQIPLCLILINQVRLPASGIQIPIQIHIHEKLTLAFSYHAPRGKEKGGIRVAIMISLLKAFLFGEIK